MQLPRYEITTTTDRLYVEFVSRGPKGAIIKRIEFTYVDELSFWNLGFGDYNPHTNRVDDQIVSDNGDGRKVLATVAFAMQEFLIVYPDATLFLTGSTDQRTRVYGWAIASYWSEISADYQVEAITESGDVVSFSPNQQPIGFLITKK